MFLKNIKWKLRQLIQLIIRYPVDKIPCQQHETP